MHIWSCYSFQMSCGKYFSQSKVSGATSASRGLVDVLRLLWFGKDKKCFLLPRKRALIFSRIPINNQQLHKFPEVQPTQTCNPSNFYNFATRHYWGCDFDCYKPEDFWEWTSCCWHTVLCYYCCYTAIFFCSSGSGALYDIFLTGKELWLWLFALDFHLGPVVSANRRRQVGGGCWSKREPINYWPQWLTSWLTWTPIFYSQTHTWSRRLSLGFLEGSQGEH